MPSFFAMIRMSKYRIFVENKIGEQNNEEFQKKSVKSTKNHKFIQQEAIMIRPIIKPS